MKNKIQLANDPNCFVHYLVNDKMDVALNFKSTLTQFHTYLEEHAEFKCFTLKPGEQKLVPHGYFSCTAADGRERVTLSQKFIKAGEGVNFYYKAKPAHKLPMQVAKPTDDLESTDKNPISRAIKNVKLKMERALK